MFAKSSFSIKCLVVIFVLSLSGCAGQQHIQDGITKASQGNFPQALKLYYKASENDNYIALSNLRIAQVYESLMQFDTALQYYEKAQQVAKNNPASEQKDTVLSESQKGYKSTLEKKYVNLEKEKFILTLKNKQNSTYYLLKGDKFEKSGVDNKIDTAFIMEIKDMWCRISLYWYNLDDIEEIMYIPNPPELSYKDRVKAYKDFLQKFPNQGYEQRANIKLDELSFEIAENNDTIEAYEQYLQEFQNGSYLQKAKAKINEMELWEKVENKEKLEDYENFLSSYPNSKYRDKANAYIVHVKAFEEAKRKNTVESYDKYLKEYPNGTYAAEARALKEAERIATEKEKQRSEEIAEKQRRKDLEKAEKQRSEEIEQLKKELFSWRNKLREGDEVQTTFITDMTFFGKDMSSSTVWYIEKIYSNGDLLLKSGSSTKKVAISYVYPPYWSLSKVKTLVW